MKENYPDLQIKKINSIYIISIETVSSSKLTNEYILKYLSTRNLFKNEQNIINDLNYNIPSISFIKINQNELIDYLLNGFTILI